jgi:superfamily II DNA or RNA helicase
MLSEGVDMPWLMWMALRKGRGSRVEFLQEFGRPLRAYPGKTEAVIFDPNEATLDHNLNGWLEIAGEETDDDKAATEPVEKGIDPLTGEEFVWDDLPEKQRREIMALGELRAYLSTAVVALTASGLLDTFGNAASKWRTNSASEKSLAFLHKFAKTAHKATTSRGYLDGTETHEQAQHVRAVARGVAQIIRGAETRTVRAGILSDVCSLARTLLWGFGRRDDNRDKFQVRADAFAALARYSVDPDPYLNERDGK